MRSGPEAAGELVDDLVGERRQAELLDEVGTRTEALTVEDAVDRRW